MANRNKGDDLEKRVGRLLIARISGTVLDSQTEAAFKEGKIGGAVIFKENADNLEQLLDLMRSIIKASYHAPVLMIDQEGGAIQRLEHMITPLPSPMALSAANDLEILADITATGARQLKALGFNCLLSPVLDVLTNPLNPVIATRALSDDPAKVAKLGKEMIAAIKSAGLVPVGKHFPGHGSTLEDSHTALAVNKADSKQLWQTDLVPFRACLQELPAILMAHVWLSAVDEEALPASLSERVTRGILREYLGYEGLIMTDDMIMKAITSKYGLNEASAMAIKAGNDLILTCGSMDETLAVNRYLVDEIKNDRLSENRIAEAISQTDRAFGSPPKAIPKSKVDQFKRSLERDTERSLEASVKAVTLLRGDWVPASATTAVPLVNSGEWLVLVPDHKRFGLNLIKHLNTLAAASRITDLRFVEVRYSLDPSAEEIERLAQEVSERHLILLTYRALLNQGQMRLGAAVAGEAREKVAVHVDVPFDIMGLPAYDHCLCTFDPSDLAMQALARVLIGKRAPEGVCPVNLQFMLQTNR